MKGEIISFLNARCTNIDLCFELLFQSFKYISCLFKYNSSNEDLIIYRIYCLKKIRYCFKVFVKILIWNRRELFEFHIEIVLQQWRNLAGRFWTTVGNLDLTVVGNHFLDVYSLLVSNRTYIKVQGNDPNIRIRSLHG